MGPPLTHGQTSPLLSLKASSSPQRVDALPRYSYLEYNPPEVSWQAEVFGAALRYVSALVHASRLQNIEDHSKTFRPQFLVLGGGVAVKPGPHSSDASPSATEEEAALSCMSRGLLRIALACHKGNGLVLVARVLTPQAVRDVRTAKREERDRRSSKAAVERARQQALVEAAERAAALHAPPDKDQLTTAGTDGDPMSGFG